VILNIEYKQGILLTLIVTGILVLFMFPLSFLLSLSFIFVLIVFCRIRGGKFFVPAYSSFSGEVERNTLGINKSIYVTSYNGKKSTNFLKVRKTELLFLHELHPGDRVQKGSILGYYFCRLMR
jgi:hypothetical protein